MTADADESVFMRREFRYGADARSVVGYAFWQMAVRSSAPLDGAALDAARKRMLSFTDEHGRPLGIVPDTLVVGVSNMTKAERLINSALINDGGVAVDNPYKGRFKLVFSPLLP
jgi:phage major head subunit gpT-like protein